MEKAVVVVHRLVSLASQNNYLQTSSATVEVHLVSPLIIHRCNHPYRPSVQKITLRSLKTYTADAIMEKLWFIPLAKTTFSHLFYWFYEKHFVKVLNYRHTLNLIKTNANVHFFIWWFVVGAL